MSFLYVRPDESFMFGSVAGDVDDTYQANWLVNGAPNFPAAGVGGLSLTVTPPAARTVSLVSVVNHNLASGVAISGGVTALIPAATLGENDIPLNSFVRITPVVGATSLVMTTVDTPSIVGELIAGRVRELQRQLKSEVEFDPGEPLVWDGEYRSLPPYDPGLEGRKITGETIVDDQGLAEIVSWWRSTRRGSRPTLIVPVDTVNDAWLVTFSWRHRKYMEGLAGVLPGIHIVQFEFTEIPRVRWPA